MFQSSLFLLTTVAVTLQVTFTLDAGQVDDAVNICQNKMKKAQKMEKIYLKADRNPTEPPLTGPLVKENMQIVYNGQQYQTVLECISRILKVNTDEELIKYDSYRNFKEKCLSEKSLTPKCDPSYRYKSITGVCNNLDHPTWGSSLQCFQRLFPANYEGPSSIRRSVQGKKKLTEPRAASIIITKPIIKPKFDYNALFVFFGQLVAHDLAELLPTTILGYREMDCCKFAGTKHQHPQCIPILLEPLDIFYSAQNVSCLSVSRSATCQTCTIGKRIQVSQASSYIDCSFMYGQTDERAKDLRTNDGTGKLKSQITTAGELLPQATNLDPTCSREVERAAEVGQYCFKGGDTRTNQHTILTTLQTLFLREHNRIAEKLKKINPHWDDEKLYQEARKITINEFQVIIYKEYLPLLLGETLMCEYGLNVGGGCNYDPEVDPAISIEFDASGFRLHSLLPGLVTVAEKDNFLALLFGNNKPLYEGRMDSYLKEMSLLPGKKYDWFMPLDLTFLLYRVQSGTYGYDLASLDILRGRDVGLPTYVQVIESMEKRPGTITSFFDLEPKLVTRCNVLLALAYDNVRDVDFWSGLLCEEVPDDMIISPTAAKIIAEQFSRTKCADRFFVEHDDTLTDEQRKTMISNTSLAKMMCNNYNLVLMQLDAMRPPGLQNVPKFCSDIPDVDLEKWKERK